MESRAPFPGFVQTTTIKDEFLRKIAIIHQELYCTKIDSDNIEKILFQCETCDCSLKGIIDFDRTIDIRYDENDSIHKENERIHTNKKSSQIDKKSIPTEKKSICEANKLIHEENKLIEKEKKTFKCKLCDYVSPIKYNLSRHVDSVHEGLKTFLCQFCSLSFSRKFDLKAHIASIHEKKKPFTCEICGYR